MRSSGSAYLVHTAVPVQIPDRLPAPRRTGELLDGFLERQAFLPHDLLKTRR
jgi:hypothetical protein